MGKQNQILIKSAVVILILMSSFLSGCTKECNSANCEVQNNQTFDLKSEIKQNDQTSSVPVIFESGDMDYDTSAYSSGKRQENQDIASATEISGQLDYAQDDVNGSDEIENQAQAEVVNQAQAEVVNQAQPEVVNQAQAEVVNQAQAEVVNQAQAEVVNQAQAEVVNQAQPEVVNQVQAEVVSQAQADDSYEMEMDEVESNDDLDMIEVVSECQNGNSMLAETADQKIHGVGTCLDKKTTVRIGIQSCFDFKKLKKHHDRRAFGWSHNWSTDFCSFKDDGAVLCHQIGQNRDSANVKTLFSINGKIKKIYLKRGKKCAEARIEKKEKEQKNAPEKSEKPEQSELSDKTEQSASMEKSNKTDKTSKRQ